MTDLPWPTTPRRILRRPRLALLFILVLGTGPTRAPAQPAWPVVELWGGPVTTGPTTGGTLTVDYAPALVNGSDYTSHSHQSINIDTSRGYGVETGVNVFLARWFGVQGAFTWSAATITGSANSSRDLFLRYVGMQPPDYVPREYTFTRSDPWADTEGRMRRGAWSVGGVGRWRTVGGTVGGTVAAGASFSHVDAELQSVSYVAFRLGGHSTLFYTEHRVVVSTSGSEWLVSPYLAADVHARVAPRLAVFGGVRVEIGMTVPVAVRAERLVDPNEDLFAPGLTELRDVLVLQPAELPSFRWQLVGGLKVFVR